MISSILLVIPDSAFGQDSVKVFPDGTMGEIHGPMDMVEKKKFPGKFTCSAGGFQPSGLAWVSSMNMQALPRTGLHSRKWIRRG